MRHFRMIIVIFITFTIILIPIIMGISILFQSLTLYLAREVF